MQDAAVVEATVAFAVEEMVVVASSAAGVAVLAVVVAVVVVDVEDVAAGMSGLAEDVVVALAGALVVGMAVEPVCLTDSASRTAVGPRGTMSWVVPSLDSGAQGGDVLVAEWMGGIGVSVRVGSRNAGEDSETLEERAHLLYVHLDRSVGLAQRRLNGVLPHEATTSTYKKKRKDC